MRDSDIRRWLFAVVIIAMAILPVGLAGCLDLTSGESSEFQMDEDLYILLGINMAIFFGFLAIFALRAGKRQKKGNIMMDATVKPGSAVSGAPPEKVPENSKICSICNTVNPPHQKFCTGCGFRL